MGPVSAIGKALKEVARKPGRLEKTARKMGLDGNSVPKGIMGKVGKIAGDAIGKQVKPKLLKPSEKVKETTKGKFVPKLAAKGLGMTNAKNLMDGKGVDSLGQKLLNF